MEIKPCSLGATVPQPALQEHYANRMRSARSSGSTLTLQKVLKFMSFYFSYNEGRKVSGNTLEGLEDTLISGHTRFVESLCVI